ncbi:hypothetical protein LUZ63_010650 [Rhynchospora breviuscula]|uniref:SAP domain-containing protein n=1 Tax=Rhynchospora breviuscula TaxID=2022672 RepID=A0A9Q0CHR9_9POAL|nr:hypothetical protein LUZ63_010650 [Rhynchospora breviuscula]
MALPLPSTTSRFPLSPPLFSTRTSRLTIVSAITSEKKSRRKKKQKPQPDSDDEQPSSSSTPSYQSISALSAAEKGLRFAFMEELMERARNRDSAGVADAIYDMVAAGLSPGPRTFHGLVVSHSLNGDIEGAMRSFRRELSAGLQPLHETFVALIRLFGSKGYATRGMEVLAAMEKLKYDIRMAWHILVEELISNNYLKEANVVFLKGAQGGIRATDELYDRMIEEDCKAGDHSNALTISYEMEAAGRMATTFHYNCLLSVQATCGTPEVALATFENMEYSGFDSMKPDTESYNWVIEAYTRAETYDRVQDVVELVGMMLEHHKRLQPNARTYALLVECYTKYSLVNEAMRHFRALKRIPGGINVLYNEGNFGDPLSLYLRSLCLEGRIPELLEALEAMSNDGQPIAPRAMIVNRKYRTLVSSWIEPLQEEADPGFEIDYIARYIEEGGLTGERKRWVPRRGKEPLNPDALGFEYSCPMETSFKQRCLEESRTYYLKILKTLRNEGPSILGDVSNTDIIRVVERLRKLITVPIRKAVRQPKAASKMLVSELREELEGQGLPTDGNRTVLYQRVQKARRINRSRGRPLWVPPIEEKEEEVDEYLEELISRIKLQDGNTEFWRSRFMGEGTNGNTEKEIETEDEDDDIKALNNEDDDATEEEDEDTEEKEVEEDDLDTEAEAEIVEEADESQMVGKEKDDVGGGPPQEMIGLQLLKDWDESPSSKKSSKKLSRVYENDDDEDWFPEDTIEAFKELSNRGYFKPSDMYTIADAWGWTWEKELKCRKPEKWSQEWEIDLSIKIMHKVIELGGTPTIGDCAMIVRAAIRAPLASAFPVILQTTHSLGYVLGSPLYDEVISLCLDLGESDAAVAVVADMETNGIKVTDEILDRVLSTKRGDQSTRGPEIEL